jgi:hypothetical protein
LTPLESPSIAASVCHIVGSNLGDLLRADGHFGHA